VDFVVQDDLVLFGGPSEPRLVSLRVEGEAFQVQEPNVGAAAEVPLGVAAHCESWGRVPHEVVAARMP